MPRINNVGTLARGLLAGQYQPGEQPAADSRAASESMNNAMGIVMIYEALEAVQRLVPVAEDARLSMVELALAWVLRSSELASAIIGASRAEQARANAAASGVDLPQSTLEAID